MAKMDFAARGNEYNEGAAGKPFPIAKNHRARFANAHAGAGTEIVYVVRVTIK